MVQRNDVAAVLEYAKPSSAINSHFDPKGRHGKYSRSLNQLLAMGVAESMTPCNLDKNERKARWINEAGVYKLVFNSGMPAAQEFQEWIYEDVIPSIRATGTYSVDQPPNSRPAMKIGTRRG